VNGQSPKNVPQHTLKPKKHFEEKGRKSEHAPSSVDMKHKKVADTKGGGSLINDILWEIVFQ